ncbi:Bgt-1830 [Blumeria graminis f. sp. tritici]|uniref:Bgt-1830 n=2 Tax=Blumeria graminis f. sp. tritici TaxID=62690 RepID=A0A381L3S6_BLUGR|nr:hypothetical protein BGT96224_1830 [Blumeria graminis f. sp. tritici 96224]VCU39613.1 Bgt-1830 [Blumeria graminis f. sp. tritici]
MSLSYEAPRTFSDYPQSAMMHEAHHDDDGNMHHSHSHRYPSPPPPLNDNQFHATVLEHGTGLDTASALIDGMSELHPKEEFDAPSPSRSKPIPKPDREITKGEDGRYVCRWPGCTEEVRTFNRKCEWSKHMDKHDRPYKCPSEGCDKLPGFTYSGGLLRHQREVHNLHGGPRKQLNCPHPNCKRFSGKGFSRQENLNEHLRRVHTDAGGDIQNGEETEDDGSERAGAKRKRIMQGSPNEDGADIRQEMARLRQENEELRRTSNSMMRQLELLQNIVAGQHMAGSRIHQGPQAPQAPMI